MVIYGIIYKAIYFSYLSLFETSIHFPSLVSECRHFLKQESIFCLFRSFRIAWEKLKVFAIFQFILWTKISTSSFKSSFKLILRCKFFTSSFKFFSSILWSQNVTSSLSAQRHYHYHCHYHYHYHYHYYHLKAKKRIGYSWYSIPEFLVISFADSVAVFDSLSDCSFLCQYWYFC